LLETSRSAVSLALKQAFLVPLSVSLVPLSFVCKQSTVHQLFRRHKDINRLMSAQSFARHTIRSGQPHSETQLQSLCKTLADQLQTVGVTLQP